MKVKTFFAFLSVALVAGIACGKGTLVLQCGSDWCVSGEYVRKVFESPEFRKALSERFELAVYDDMESPTPKVKAENERLNSLCVKSKRFPAISCITDNPKRFFALIENIPYDVTAQALSDMVNKAVKNRREAENLFKRGSGKGAPSADAIGRGFELLEAQAGELNISQLYEGKFAWKESWEHLKKIDADDRYGWRRRFTMGYGFDFVEAATEYSRRGKDKEWGSLLKTLQSIPTNHLKVVQRQAIEMAQFAFRRARVSGSGAVSESDTALLRGILNMGRNTVWGQCALGYLNMAGEGIETVEPYRAKVRERPEDDASSAEASFPAFPLPKIIERLTALKIQGEGFSEQEKRDIALYAVLRRIGESGWDGLKFRPGVNKFMRAFFSNREWMEDFAWSGSCREAASSLLALESIYFQDNGRWMDEEDGCARRFATATALEKPNADEAFLADWLDAYRSTALSNRLHKAAYTQPVWQWRYAIRQIHGSSETDDPPNQQRFLDKFFNVSAARFGSALGVVPYRLFNCFGESVHTPKYYRPWVTAGEWPKRKYSYIVGGVCGELSTFASCCANAHGVPSIPVGQPGHCAYTRRLPEGKWVIGNFISPPTGFSGFWPRSSHWTYALATEATFEGDREKRLDAERFLELAHLAESRDNKPQTVMKLFRLACSAWRENYTAWREYGQWIVRANRSIEEHRRYALTAVKVLEGWRHPLWDLLTPYFARVADECGSEALTEAIEEFAPLLRQPNEALQDDGDISLAIKTWASPLEDSPELMERAVNSIVAGQYGTKKYYTQVLGWCASFVFADEKRAKKFLNMLPKFAEKFAKSMHGVIGGAKIVAEAKNNKPDLGSFILAAESSGNIAAFRQFASMQDKIGRPVSGLRFAERDSNGELVSAEGMLSLSKSCPADTPSLHPRAIDSSAVQGYTFTTDSQPEPWAMVTLAGDCIVRAIVVVLRSPSEESRRNQLPIEVEVSEDGVNWKSVMKESQLRDQYRVEFPLYKAPKARYVRVRRLADERKDGREKLSKFSLSKILVYGRKLY